MYYLETNAVRILCNKLNRDKYLDRCYSSILVLCELLSGIVDDSTFIERKGIIIKFLRSNIRSDLNLPETKLYQAYGIQVNNRVGDKILLIAGLLFQTKSFTDFNKRIINDNLVEYWDFLRKYDNAGNIKFRESFKERQDKFDYSDRKMIPDFKDRWDNLNGKPNLKQTILNDLIIYFAETFLQPSKVIKVSGSVEDLVKSYDHSLDFYFLSIGYFTGTKIILKNAPSRNDYFDICHIMYLRNPSDVIVSNDMMLRKLMTKIHPENILSTMDLEKKIE